MIDLDRPSIASTFVNCESLASLYAGPDRTIVVFGVPRGGTTMVAGVCQRCGIDMGSNLPVNLEDPDFTNKPVDHMRSVIEARNTEKPIWGWKFPRAASYLPDLRDILRNPVFVVVWRDLLATAARGIRRSGEMMNSLSIASRTYTQNLEFVSSTTIPVLHISYEKAVQHPVRLAEDIQRFTGVQEKIRKKELIEFAQPGRYKKPKRRLLG